MKEYILVKGNGEAEEILQDYAKYVHKLGYVIQRRSVPKRRHNPPSSP
jgi:hypothetical protein